MKASKFLLKTLKEVPRDADSVNASFLVRAGYVAKNMAGVYALLPLGFKVYQKIENIIREEMNAVDGQEVLMNVLQPKELWDETGRWQETTDVMYRIKDQEIGLAITHEEQVTDIVRKKISSYKDLPLALYQIQVKFRNEPRAKSGLLRGREFMMKDMYSFHETQEDCDQYYEKVKNSYAKIFARLGFETKITDASGGVISNQKSHEFHVLAPTGEDTIFYCDKCDYSVNQEIAEVKAGDKCPECDGIIKESAAIELGHIFHLKDKYSKPMKANFIGRDGQAKPMIMGCYGIGLTRVLATLVEVYFNQQENKMVWPKPVAPFAVEIISLNKDGEATKLYQELSSKKIEVLYDDRELSAGEKFADADLVGAPIRIIVSEKSLAAGGVEIIDGLKSEVIEISKVLEKIS